MKLKKSTVLIIILSWILFFAACFLAFLKLDQMHTDRITNEKIFSSKKTTESTTQSEQGQASTEKEGENTQIQAIEDFTEKYYEYIQKNDLNSLKSMVEDFDDLKKKQEGLTQYVEAYKDLSYVVQQGANEESYIVFVTYQLKIKNIDTLAPGMTPYYVIKRDDTYLIYNNESHYTKEMVTARDQCLNKEEVKKLIEKINKEYEKAVQSDEKLKDFLENSQESQ